MPAFPLYRIMPDGQDAFTAALLDPERKVPDGVVNPNGVPATKRFDVYRNNVVQSLSEALSQAFPVIEKLVGAEFFAAMAVAHVRAHPPRTPVMMFYGQDFPAFLETFPPVQSLPYLADIARLELARREAYHAADDPVAAPEDLGAIPPEALGAAYLDLHASARIIRSPYPVLGIWRANMEDGAEQPVLQPEDVLVSRPSDTVLMTLLGPGDAAFLNALKTETLGSAAETAAEETAGSAKFDLSAAFERIFAAGILTGIRIKGKTTK